MNPLPASLRRDAPPVQLVRDRRGAIRLALLDLTMPGMGGFDTWRELRHLRPNLPILLSSGYSEQALDPEQSRDPLTSFLQKPYDREAFGESVRELLSRTSKR